MQLPVSLEPGAFFVPWEKALYDPQTPNSLRPEKAQILIDEKYILAAMGLLSQYYPLAALEIMKKEIADYGHNE